MKKKEIIDILFKNHEQTILDLKERISDALSMIDLDENDTIDPEDFSHSEESKELNELMYIQLAKAEKELEKLKSIDFSTKSKIEEGAIVTTEKFTFCIGIATVPFKIGDGNLMGISINAPIYEIMKDKTVGDGYTYNENQYKILEIN